MSCIPISRRYLRSVNLRADSRSGHGLSGYVVTPSVRQAIATISESFTDVESEHSFTLTGPYGTGKSAFALFLSSLLSDAKGAVWKMLSNVDAPLAKDAHEKFFGKSTKTYAVLAITAHRASVSSLFAECFEGWNNDFLSASMAEKVSHLKKSTDTKTSVRLITECVAEICKSGYLGVFFIFDEFGKVFEQARYAGDKTDVFLLQELAEASSRSHENPFWFLGLLHQSFSDYAGKDSVQRNEFSKIEGRFVSISFVESIASQVMLTAYALEENSRLTKDGGRMIDAAVKNGVPSLVGLSEADYRKFASRAFPIHPLTLVSMPYLLRRFGQNERSIFTFLSSNESASLQSFASLNGLVQPFRLCDFFDYLFNNFETQLSRHPYGHAFVEADDILRSKPGLTDREREVIKTVAVLTSLGMQSPIQSNAKTIDLALAYPAGEELHRLQTQSILVYRKFNSSYAIWEGSDIDLEDCYKEADIELGKTGFSLASTLMQFVKPTPAVARRHSVKTGSLRFFETVYADSPDDLELVTTSAMAAPYSGRQIICLPSGEAQRQTFINEATRLSRDNPALIFAIPGNVAELADALMEVRRLNWIEDNIRDLRDDRIARREVELRKADANQAVTQYQFGLLDPRPAPDGGACVYVNGGAVRDDIRTSRDVSAMLSAVCDRIYPYAPKVLNELINKRIPSSQAAAARRIIVNAMNDSERVAKPLFGIEGFPPSRSIYESVVAASGMHKQKEGAWCLCPPAADAPTNLAPVWKRIDELIFADRGEPLNMKELCAELAKPPYGILDGLFPILIAAFYALNRDEVSLYYEGTFTPEPGDATFELIARRPELFAISGMRLSGARQRVVERLARGFRTEPKINSVVRLLYAVMNSLSKYARETDSVSELTRKFRKAFADAKYPDRLLFVDLPQAFGLPVISADSSADGTFQSFFDSLNFCLNELRNALPLLIADNRRLLLESCGFENSAEGWQSLYDKCSFLLARTGGSDLVPFLQNIANTAGDWEKADQVISYIQQVPMDKWGPMQIREFARNVKGLSERFKAACIPYANVSAALSAVERKKVDAISKKIREVVSGAPGLVRAALLKCLQELDGTENA